MPPNFITSVGGSDMNLPVASLFLLSSVTLLAPIAHGQTTHRRVSKSTLIKPRGATVKICQGLPIPAGYIITAYMTTSACPHGAYVIKKQHDTDPESSKVANKKQDDSEGSLAANNKPNTESESSGPANKKRDTGSRTSVAVNRGLRQPAETSASVSRPRRVGAVEADSDLPSLRGAETTAAPKLPTLNGVTPIYTP